VIRSSNKVRHGHPICFSRLSTAMSVFAYDELDPEGSAIRLLRVLPRCAERLECIMETFTHETSPDYEALSYAWGSKNDFRQIVVNDGALEISVNLWNFLDQVSRRNLARPGCSRKSDTYQPQYLWIDQICINQRTIAEKNHQVRRMAAIFQKARRVVVWLGMPGARDQHALEILVSMKGSHAQQMDQDTIATALQLERKAFEAVFSQPFWSRLWVVQEILLARSALICYGRHIFRWEELYKYDTIHSVMSLAKATKYSSRRDTMKWMVIGKLMDGRNPSRHRQSQRSKMDLAAALSSFNSMECEDARDKVYGLLSLIHKKDRVTVDYSRPSALVFWDLVAILVRNASGTMLVNKWLIPLGISMRVKGYESNAMAFKAIDITKPGYMYEFRWPNWASKVKELAGQPGYASMGGMIRLTKLHIPNAVEDIEGDWGEFQAGDLDLVEDMATTIENIPITTDSRLLEKKDRILEAISHAFGDRPFDASSDYVLDLLRAHLSSKILDNVL